MQHEAAGDALCNRVKMFFLRRCAPCPVPAAAALVMFAVDEDAAEEAAAAHAAAAERAAAAAAGPTRVVSITRPAAMEEARRQLPIIGLEQEIMEGIAHNDVVVGVTNRPVLQLCT